MQQRCAYDHTSLTPSQVYLVRGEGYKCGGCRALMPDYEPPNLRGSFEPIVVHVNAAGDISVPARTDDRPPEGYIRRELTTLREVDKFCREFSKSETLKKRMHVESERVYWDDRTKRRREQIRTEMERRGMKTRYFDAVCKYVDKKREERYAKLGRQEVNIVPKIFSYDGKAAHSYADVDTGFHIKRY